MEVQTMKGEDIWDYNLTTKLSNKM